MSKAPWKKEICRCEVCRKCKRREYMRLKRSGEWKPFVAKGRARERQIQERKAEKKRLLEEKKAANERRLAMRAKRDEAFKWNKWQYGLKRAKFIAVLVKEKIKGIYGNKPNS